MGIPLSGKTPHFGDDRMQSASVKTNKPGASAGLVETFDIRTRLREQDNAREECQSEHTTEDESQLQREFTHTKRGRPASGKM